MKRVLLIALALCLFPGEGSARHYRRHHARPARPVHHVRPAREKVEPEEKKVAECPPVPTVRPWSVWLSTERFHADYETHVYKLAKVRPASFNSPKDTFDSERPQPRWTGVLSKSTFTQDRDPKLERDLLYWFARYHIGK